MTDKLINEIRESNTFNIKSILHDYFQKGQQFSYSKIDKSKICKEFLEKMLYNFSNGYIIQSKYDPIHKKSHEVTVKDNLVFGKVDVSENTNFEKEYREFVKYIRRLNIFEHKDICKKFRNILRNISCGTINILGSKHYIHDLKLLDNLFEENDINIIIIC